MRWLMTAALFTALITPAQAGTSNGKSPAPDPRVDCQPARVEHAAAPERRPARKLGGLPPAYRLHTVNRRVASCEVHPEARRVSDRTGQIGPDR